MFNNIREVQFSETTQVRMHHLVCAVKDEMRASPGYLILFPQKGESKFLRFSRSCLHIAMIHFG